MLTRSHQVPDPKILQYKRGILVRPVFAPLELDLQLPPFQLIHPDLVPVGVGVGPLRSELQERFLDLGAVVEQRAVEVAVEVEAGSDAGVVEQCRGAA